MSERRNNVETEQDLSAVTTELRGVSGFDASAFERLLEDTSPSATLRILARFNLSLQETVPLMMQSMQSGQIEPIWKSAHKLAGSAEMLGFKEFGLQSKHLSSQLKNSEVLGTHAGEVTVYISEARAVMNLIGKAFPNLKSYL